MSAPDPGDDPFESGSIEVPLTLDYALMPARTSALEPPLLVAMHGWGQTCRRFIRSFQPLAEAGIAVLAPQAPHPFYVQHEPRRIGFSWLTSYERDRSVRDLNRYLGLAIDAAAERARFSRSRVVLLGFSQGVSTASRFAVSGAIEPAGLIGCCADLPADVAERLPYMPRFPVLLACSPEDMIVPAEKTRNAHEQYTAHGFDVELFEFAGGHVINDALVARIQAWIEQLPAA